MTRRFGLALFLGILVTAAASADTQFGGLLKGAGTAIKKGAPPATAPGGGQSAATSECPVDQAAMDRLMKALEAQHAEREAALKDAAAAKSKAQYEACVEQVAFSPDADKILASFDPADPSKSEAAINALNRARCGPPPDEARQQARNRFFAAARPSSKCDDRLLEFAIPFCALPPSERASAQKAGVRAPNASGKDFWIYTAAEAATFAPYCARLLALTDAEKSQLQQVNAN
jgi:hypothetical protein